MRRITLDVETIALLAEHRERCAGVLAEGRSELAGDHFVFSADPARQKPRNPDSISNRYRRMAENLGIDTHIHALRHYSATELLSSDVDLRTVARTARPRRRPNVDQATYQVQLTAIGESDVRQFVRDFYLHNDMSRDMSPKQCLRSSVSMTVRRWADCEEGSNSRRMTQPLRPLIVPMQNGYIFVYPHGQSWTALREDVGRPHGT